PAQDPRKRIVFMRRFGTALFSIVLGCTALAQLSNQFISGALKALRSVNSMSEAPVQDSPGHIIAPRYVTEAISAADDLARSRSELKVIDLLKGFLDDKIQNNTTRQVLVLNAQNSWMENHMGASAEW